MFFEVLADRGVSLTIVRRTKTHKHTKKMFSAPESESKDRNARRCSTKIVKKKNNEENEFLSTLLRALRGPPSSYASAEKSKVISSSNDPHQL